MTVTKEPWARSFTQSITDYHSTASIGSYFRQRRAKHIVNLIEQCFEVYHKVDIVDIGGRPSYWNIIPEAILEKNRVHITLINYSDELGEVNHPRFKSVIADGCDLHQYESQSFQLAHSNSVVEHVGNWDKVSALASEIKRLAPAYYVQTPNFWFPLEPHFMTPIFHWLPKPVQVQMISRWTLGHMNKQTSTYDAVQLIESVRLLDSTMFFSLFDDAERHKERILGLPKSLIALKGCG